MRAALALTVAMALALGLLVPTPVFAQGSGEWFKFLFTPQAGLNSVSLSCGWHDGPCTPGASTGSALDFPGDQADTETVYFRSFGFNRLDYAQMAAYGTPFNFPDAICKTNYVRIYDTGSNILGTMWYTHTYLYPGGGNMMMLAIKSGVRNQSAFAGMVQAPWDETVPEDQRENWACYDQEPDPWWTGVHLHEESADSASTFLLNYDRYPTVPGSGGPYDPQDWELDWARALCINDTDCDDWTDSEESYLGTDPLDNCPDHSSHDAWPLDINMDKNVTVVGDVLAFRGRVGASPGDAEWWQRLDFNADAYISVVGDVLKYNYSGMVGESCT